MESSLKNGPDCIKCCTSNSSEEFMFDNYNHRLIVNSIVALIAVTGTCGNALVIIAVLVSRKLRTTTNVFVVNLSLSDLVSCVVLPFNVYTGLYRGEDRPLPDWLCMGVSHTLLLGLGTCIFSLSLIAINRYFKVTKSLATYQKVYRRRFIALMVALSWVYPSILIGVTFAISDSGHYGYSRKYRVCFHDTRAENSSTVNHIGGLLLLIPTFIVTLVAYALIYRHVRRHNKKRLETVQMRFHPSSNDGDADPATNQGNPTSVATKDIPPSGDTERMPQDADERSRDAPRTQVKSNSPRTRTSPEKRIRKVMMDITRSLFIIVCVHIVLMLPYAIAILTECSDFTFPWVFVLFVATPALNPLVYGWKHPHFRMVFKSLLTCKYRDIPEPSQLGRRCLCFNRSSYYV